MRDNTSAETSTVEALDAHSEHIDSSNDTVDADNTNELDADTQKQSSTESRASVTTAVIADKVSTPPTEMPTVDDANDDSEHVEIKKEVPTPYPSGLTWCKLVSSADKWGLIDRIKHRFGIDYDNIGEFVGEYAIPLASNPFNTPARLVKRNGERWEYGYVMRDFFNATERVITDILMHQRKMQKRKAFDSF